MGLSPIQESSLYTALILLGLLFLLFIIFRNLLRYNHELKQAAQKKQMLSERGKHVFPMQINAYERMVMYLERIKPSSLLYRNNSSANTAMELQAKMLNNIREELEHNLSVQMYVSTQAWNAVLSAQKESREVVKLAAKKAGGEASKHRFSSEVLKIDEQLKQSAAEKAVLILKAEMKSFLQG